MWKVFVLLVLVPSLTIVSCDDSALDKLRDGIARFTGKFLYDRMKASEGQNIITSPYSVFNYLAQQLMLYSDDETLDQLRSVLNVENKDDIRTGFLALAASFDGQTSEEFMTTGTLFIYPESKLFQAFLNASANRFDAEDSEDLNFNTSIGANIINERVDNITNGRINDLMEPVSVNTIYFKGDWFYSFDVDRTITEDFYLSDGTTKKTKLMYQEAQFNYGNDPYLDLKVFEVYFNNQNFSMVFVLPNVNDGVMKVAENLQDPEIFNKVLGSMRRQTVRVYLPTFEINTTTDLANILQQEGVTKIFNRTDSGSSRILEIPEDIYITRASQTAFIKVDTKGTETPAVNVSVGAAKPSLPSPPPKVFRADHAFLFYIRLLGTTIFAGVYNG